MRPTNNLEKILWERVFLEVDGPTSLCDVSGFLSTLLFIVTLIPMIYFSILLPTFFFHDQTLTQERI